MLKGIASIYHRRKPLASRYTSTRFSQHLHRLVVATQGYPIPGRRFWRQLRDAPMLAAGGTVRAWAGDGFTVYQWQSTDMTLLRSRRVIGLRKAARERGRTRRAGAQALPPKQRVSKRALFGFKYLDYFAHYILRSMIIYIIITTWYVILIFEIADFVQPLYYVDIANIANVLSILCNPSSNLVPGTRFYVAIYIV